MTLHLGQHELGLNEILNRAEYAYASARNDAEALDSEVLAKVREHFNSDVPALIGAVKRLTGELEDARRELGRLRTERDGHALIVQAATALRDRADMTDRAGLGELIVDLAAAVDGAVTPAAEQEGPSTRG